MECADCGYFNRDDDTCEAFECNGLECPKLPCEVYWVFTFGHDISRGGEAVRVFANTYEEARTKMCEKYGTDWAFQYSADEWEEMENDHDINLHLEKITEEIQ